MASTPLPDLFGPGTSARHTQSARSTGGGLNPVSWLTGFGGNILGGARDVVTGLTGIASGVGTDAIKILSGNPHGLFVPRFLSQAPGSIASDYASRYGSISGFGKGLYEQPLSFLFDLLGAGAIAEKGASFAAKAGVESPIIDAILPKTRPILQNPIAVSAARGADVSAVVDKTNPVTRFLYQQTFGAGNPVTRFLHTANLLPIQNLEQEAGLLQAAAKDGTLSTEENIRLLKMQTALDKARGAGAAYYERQAFTQRQAARTALKITSQSINVSQQMTAVHRAEIAKRLEPLGVHAGGVMERVPAAMMGLDPLGMQTFDPSKFIPQIQAKGFQTLGDAQDTVASHMEPASGMVRVFRGEGAGRTQGGNWFTTDQRYAQQYAGPYGKGPLLYVDLPEEVASANLEHVLASHQHTPFAPEASAEFTLPPEWVSQARPLADPRAAALHPDEVAALTRTLPVQHDPGLDVRPYGSEEALNTNWFSVQSRNLDSRYGQPLDQVIVGTLPDGRRYVQNAGVETPQQGMGTRLYAEASRQAQKLGTVLVSGESSPAARALWQSMERRGAAARVSGIPEGDIGAWEAIPQPVSFGLPGWNRALRPIQAQDLGMAGQAVQPTQDLYALQSAAQTNEVPFLDALRKTYGPGVVTRVKPLDRIVSKFATDGMAPTDALGGRVILADAKQAPEALAKLQQSFPVVSVEDTRAMPNPLTGERRLAATVRLPDGTLGEVEFGTGVWSETRDVAGTTSHLIERMQTELASVTQKLQMPADEINFKALSERAQFLQKAIEDSASTAQSLWAGAADELDAQLNGKVMPGAEARAAFESVRRYVYGAFTKPMIDTGIFDPSKAFQRSYLPLRMQAGAEWDTGLKDLSGPAGSDARTIHDARMQQDLPMPIYYPFYNVDKVGPADMLSTVRSLQGGLKKVENPSFLKQATGKLLRDGKVLMDPKQALMKRATDMIRLQETVDMYHKILNEFGRPIGPDDFIDHANEVRTAPRGSLNMFNAKLGLTDKVLSKIIGTTTLTDDQLQAIVSEVMPATQRDIIGITKQGVQEWALPKVVAQQFERHYIVPAMENNVRLFWDTGMKVWRSLILTGRPAWVANNTLGNIFFLKMQPGTKLFNVVRQMDEMFMHAIGNKDYVGFRTAVREAVPEAQRAGVYTGGLIKAEGPESTMNLGVARDTRAGQFLDAASNTWHSNRILKHLHTAGQYVRHINASIEDAFRSASYLGVAEKQAIKEGTINGFKAFWTAKEDLRRIAQHGINPEIAKKALDTVNYFQNDYNLLGPIERHFIRRYMVPFYSFYKHVTKLALRYPFDYGARAAVAAGFARFTNEMDRQMYGAVPSWLRGATPLGDPSGNTSFLGGATSNPFSTLLSYTDFTGFGMLAPPFKIAAEQALGKSTLTGRDFTDANVVYPFGASQGYRIVTDAQGRVIDELPVGPGQPGGPVAPGLLEHLLQQIPQYTLLKEALAGGKTYDTENLLSVLTGTGAAKGYTGQSLPVSWGQAIGRYVGVPTYNFNLPNYQAGLAKGASDAAATYAKSRAAAPVPPALASQSRGALPDLFG